MTPTDQPLRPEGGESLYDFLTTWAAHAVPRRLAIIAIAALGTATLVLLGDRAWWPLAAFALVPAMVAIWGLVHHRWEAHHSQLLKGIEWLLVGLGSLLLLLAGVGLMVVVLGQPWKL